MIHSGRKPILQSIFHENVLLFKSCFRRRPWKGNLKNVSDYKTPRGFGRTSLGLCRSLLLWPSLISVVSKWWANLLCNSRLGIFGRRQWWRSLEPLSIFSPIFKTNLIRMFSCPLLSSHPELSPNGNGASYSVLLNEEGWMNEISHLSQKGGFYYFSIWRFSNEHRFQKFSRLVPSDSEILCVFCPWIWELSAIYNMQV